MLPGGGRLRQDAGADAFPAQVGQDAVCGGEEEVILVAMQAHGELQTHGAAAPQVLPPVQGLAAAQQQVQVFCTARAHAAYVVSGGAANGEDAGHGGMYGLRGFVKSQQVRSSSAAGVGGAGAGAGVGGAVGAACPAPPAKTNSTWG